MTMLVERYYDALLHYMVRMCGGRQTVAEDMVQETFLRMMRKITLYNPARPFKPWLYAIATNIARNYYQLADTRYAVNPVEDVDFADKQPQPEDVLMQSEQAQGISRALAQLPDHQREVVVLFYYQEMPQKDIAEILNIPVGTVKSRLSLGLKRIRAMIDAMEKQK